MCNISRYFFQYHIGRQEVILHEKASPLSECKFIQGMERQMFIENSDFNCSKRKVQKKDRLTF